MVFKKTESATKWNLDEDVKRDDRDDILMTSIQNRWISQLMSKPNKRQNVRFPYFPRCRLRCWMLSWYDIRTEFFTEHWCSSKRKKLNIFSHDWKTAFVSLRIKFFLNSSTRIFSMRCFVRSWIKIAIDIVIAQKHYNCRPFLSYPFYVNLLMLQNWTWWSLTF